MYQQLSTAKNEIRVLHIAPSDDPSSIVCCYLEHISLNKPPPYAALSYCWGDANVTEQIRLNNSDKSATTNLVAALRQLRADGLETLWVDALCINQDDPDERASQVQLMKYTFEEATQVVVWVGLEDDASNKAQDFMKQMGRSASEFEAFRKYQKGGAKSEKFSASWEALESFFARPYWRRVWIVQEIATAANVSVQCGNRASSWEDVQRLLQCQNDLVDFEKYRESIRSKAQLGTLLQALYDTRNSLATDPKDKIYALLGLVSDSNTIAGLPNYTLALETMLKKITKNMLMREKNLNLIVVKSQNLTRTHHHPSWLSELTNLGNALLPWQEAYFNLPESGKYCNLEFIGDELFVTGIHKSAIASITTTSNGVTSEDKAKARELSIERASPSISHGLLFHTLSRSPYHSPGTSSEYDKTVVSKFLTALGSDESQDYIKQNHPQWLDWLTKNGHFVVGNRRLGTYFEPPKRIERRGTKAWRDARDVAAAVTLISTLPLWIVEEVKRRKDEPGTGSNPWQDKVERFFGLHEGMEAGKTDVEHLSYLITEFESMLRFGLTLFTTSTGDIGMATSVAMKNDSIYEIRGCAKPIILRSFVDGWKVIGEAYFCKFDAIPGKEQRLKLI